MTLTKTLKFKSKEFLQSRKHSNNLLDILGYFAKDGMPNQPWILAIEKIFSELIRKREMLGVADKAKKGLPNDYPKWLRECYADALGKLYVILETGDLQDQSQSLSTLMKLLSLEGKFPLQVNSEEYYFPFQRLRDIVVKLLSSRHDMESLIKRMSEWTCMPDVRHNLWTLIMGRLKHIESPSDAFQCNLFSLLDVLIPTKLVNQRKRNSETTPVLPLCHTEGQKPFEFDEDLEEKFLNKIWKYINKWKRKETATHHRMLMLLLTKVLHRLSNPLPLTNLLFDSFEQGGPTSLLALQGVFILIQKHNLDYPNIYAKLYSLFEPMIFGTKYKTRLFYLADIFLSSTHVPEIMVASFAKRLSRLALIASPSDILLILAFVGNLILRHPGLKKMMDHPGGGTVNSDPFLVNEEDPMKTHALDSSLWEIKSLQRHVLPSISTAACFIDNPLPSVEWDLEPLLEGSNEKIFEVESKKKAKEVAVTFVRPRIPSQPHRNEEIFPKLWKIM